MADYKVTDSELTSVANAIRTKGGTQAQLEWPTGFSTAIAAIPSGGGGGGQLHYADGDYIGEYSGSSVDTFAVNLSAPVGTVALLAIMHRTAILSGLEGWTLLAHKVNPEYSGSTNQEISIYKKTMAANSENFTVNLASSGRTSASTFYFEEDISITSYQELPPDDTYELQVTIPKTTDLLLAVYSGVYASEVATDISPRNVTPVRGGYNSLGTGTIPLRFLASIINSPKDTVLSIGTTKSTEIANVNRMYTFVITGAS